MTFENKFLNKPIATDKTKPLLEKAIEGAVGRYAKRLGVITDKFTSPSKRSVPDQIYTFPNGRVIFIEFKALGKKPTPKQAEDHEKRRANNALVYVIDTVDSGKLLVNFYLNKTPIE